MGDYYAASKLCAVPPPPRHAINRGLFSEGLAGVLAGFMGASHATTSYSTHIALIGITRVRQVYPLILAEFYFFLIVQNLTCIFFRE